MTPQPAADPTPPAPWLARVPAGLFAIPFGLLGLGGAWRRAAGFGWPWAEPLGVAIARLAVALLAACGLVYAAKALRHPQALGAEFSHPVPGSVMALLPLSVLMTVLHFGAPRHLPSLVAVLAALALQGVIAVRTVGMLATGAMRTAAVTPALYLPSVAGGFIGGMALATIGWPGWAALLFGMGLAAWALLEVRVLNRLFEGPMPESLRPTIGIELAPPALATLAAATIWPALPGEVLVVGLGIAAGPILTVAARWRWWGRVPFSIGFWSFSFPLAALASAFVEVVARGGWPSTVGAIALGVASAAIAYLALRTVGLALRGRLLPPPMVPAGSR
jgi:tellurite resistance protein